MNKKNILIGTILIGIIGIILIVSPKFGEAQLSIEDAISVLIQDYQSNQLATKGKYRFLPKTFFDDNSSYRVNEMQHGDGTKSYQIIFEHYENIQRFNSTTSQMETVPILKQKSIGFGKEAISLTWTK